MTEQDIAKLVTYWLSGSEYDWKTALSLKKSKKYPYALFFVHLSLEKFLKGIIVKQTKEHAPFSHNLAYLLGKTDLEPSQKILDDLQKISDFNMESRYPDEELAFYQRANNTFTEEWFKKAGELKKWLKKEYDNK
ncbi:MAG: HEPN domain-containing protein [Bacteriovoracaceae bacterium]|nr:HEPN domain-containing protein [Bacteriovoracaceae bacterium]